MGAFPEGHAVNAHEVRPGVVYKDANVTVTAFPTKHTMESFGYRFDAPDRSVVISGDTNPAQATIDACDGCDVLIHEVLTNEWLAKRRDFQAYAAQFHTTTTQLTELATKAKPRLLILYHASLSLRPAVDSERSTPAALLGEMRNYAGHVVVGRDLMCIDRWRSAEFRRALDWEACGIEQEVRRSGVRRLRPRHRFSADRERIPCLPSPALVISCVCSCLVWSAPGEIFRVTLEAVGW